MAKTKRLTAWLILSLIGLGVSIYLSNHYYALRGGQAGFSSICKVSEAMNCDAVAGSRWAEVLPGLPLSSFGAGFYLAMALLSIFARSEEFRSAAIRGGFLLAGAGSAISLIYLGIMAGVIRTWCLFCLIQDGIVFALLAVIASIRSQAQAGFAPGQAKTVLTTFAGSTAAMVFLLWVLMTPEKLKFNPQDIASSVLATPPVTVQGIEGAPFVGAANAPITIVEFSDFQCPHCKAGAQILNTVLLRYPGKVRVVLKPYPLDPSCNRMMKGQGHSGACEAARIAHCAHKAGHFKHAYETIFENQELLATQSPREIVKNNGLPASALDGCIDSEETKKLVLADIEEGVKQGVQATPTYFINGYKVEGGYPVPIWEILIERLLAASPAK